MINGKKPVVILIGSILVLLLSLPVFQSSTVDSTRLDIHLSKNQVETGDVFFVTVSISQSEPVIGIQLNLSFDPSLVRADSVTNANPSIWNFFGPPVIDNTLGMISKAGVAVMGSTVSTPTDCFIISFISLDKDGIVSFSLPDIIILNGTADQIEPVVTMEKNIVIGTGVDEDSSTQDTDSSLIDTCNDTSVDDDFANQDNDSLIADEDEEYFLDHDPPETSIDFTFSPIHPRVKDDIIFQVELSDVDQEIMRYHWDFGDENIATERDPNHRYSEPGTYLVTLSFWDDNESIYTVSKDIMIEPVQHAVEETDEGQELIIEEAPGYEIFIIFITFLIVIGIKINGSNRSK